MKKITFIILVTVVLFSCSNKKEEKEKLRLKIGALEEKYAESVENQKIDPVLVRDLANEYANYSRLFPRDTNAPGMIYKAGVINLKYIGDYKEAINLFIRLKEKYPKFKDTPMALYTAAYIYNDLLRDAENAKECYELLIKDYPDHYLTKEAKILIQFVGKSDEQLLNAIIGKEVDSSKPNDESK
jgi:tetratricopeptide (TPR) repeat protein